MNKEINIIKNLIEGVHGTAVWYIQLLKDTNPNEQFTLNGKQLNSLFWIVGHLAWAEDMLLIRGAGRKGFLEKYPILKKFQLGGAHNASGIEYRELQSMAKEIHVAAMKQLEEMTDDELDKPNAFGFTLFDTDTVRGLYYHQIRHVGSHIGQLGWLCKLNGIQTV